MTLSSHLLSAIPGLRHAFFTRDGGVSEGIYAGLNGGIGSNDDPAHVVENRRRMAQTLGVEPSHFLTVYQVHSAEVVTVGDEVIDGSISSRLAAARTGLPD